MNSFSKGMTGSAVFVPLNRDMYFTRQEIKRRMIAGEAETPFLICAEELFYSDFLKQSLWDNSVLKNLFSENVSAMKGSTDGRIRCLAAWQCSDGEGLLIHKEADMLFCSSLPVITKEEILKEKLCAEEISLLAEKTSGLKTYLKSAIRSGQQDLAAILHLLAESMKTDR